MSRSLLIVPSFFYPNWWWDKDEEILVPPIGASLISSAMSKAGVDHDVLYMDMEYLDTMDKLKNKAYSEMGESGEKSFEWQNYPFSDEYFRYKLSDSLNGGDDWFARTYRGVVDAVIKRALSYDCVLLSMFDTTTPTGWYISKMIKRDSPHIVTIWGGFHTLFLFRLFYKDVPSLRYSYTSEELAPYVSEFEEICDIVMFGESDEDIQSVFSGSPGAYYSPKHLRLLNSVHESCPRDLYKLPPVSFDKFLCKDFTGLMTYMTRGCPYRCKFCDLTSWFGRVRLRPVVDVFNEMIENSTKFGLNKFAFADPTINASPERLKALIQSLRIYSTQITSQCTLKTWDEELTDLNEKFRTIHSLYTGIENTEDSTRELMNKGGGLNFSQALDKLKLIHEADIKMGAFWMVGFPGEEPHDLNKVREALQYCDSSTIAVYNMGWYSKLAMGYYDDYVEKAESITEISPEEFKKHHYVFSDLPGLNMGFTYKIDTEELVGRFNRLTNVIEEELG